jgi:hypothetical protein
MGPDTVGLGQLKHTAHKASTACLPIRFACPSLRTWWARSLGHQAAPSTVTLLHGSAAILPVSWRVADWLHHHSLARMAPSSEEAGALEGMGFPEASWSCSCS